MHACLVNLVLERLVGVSRAAAHIWHLYVVSLLLSFLYQGYDFFGDLNACYVWHAVVKDEDLVKVLSLVSHDLA